MPLLAICALAVACALLSVFVIARKWAFIGEGISHAGFGGAGTAWMLALLFPAAESRWFFQLTIILFCLVTALAIGKLSRAQNTSTDAAIGIFMVASLAWGFLAEHVYLAHRRSSPFGFEDILFGNMSSLGPHYATATLLACLIVIAAIAALWKEILYYCLDPVLAEVSGVPAIAVHYLLMFLLAIVIIVGVRIVGSVLVTALLVLPGATAARTTQKLNTTMLLSVGSGLICAVGGVTISRAWPFLPAGPCIVLTLFVVFLLTTTGALLRKNHPN